MDNKKSEYKPVPYEQYYKKLLNEYEKKKEKAAADQTPAGGIKIIKNS
jgi:hypothetical protein